MNKFEAPELLWWGYLHVNGGLHLKRYFGREDIRQATESPFVDEAYGPFEADTRDEAELILHQRASKGR